MFEHPDNIFRIDEEHEVSAEFEAIQKAIRERRRKLARERCKKERKDILKNWRTIEINYRLKLLSLILFTISGSCLIAHCHGNNCKQAESCKK